MSEKFTNITGLNFIYIFLRFMKSIAMKENKIDVK